MPMAAIAETVAGHYVAVLRVSNGHILIFGYAQSCKSTYEGSAVVVVLCGFQGRLEALNPVEPRSRTRCIADNAHL